MTEGLAAPDGSTAAVEPAPGDGITAGVLLRRAREAAGLHVAALAVSLKVPVRKLEALEADRYDLMPDLVFVRALASSICRSLKIDPRPVLERLPQTVAPRLVRDIDGINAPFRAPSDGAPPSWFDQLTRPVFLAVFALLLGALILILLPTAQPDDNPAPGKNATVVSEATPAVTSPPAQDAASAPAAVMDTAIAPVAAASAALPVVPPASIPPAPVAASPARAASLPAASVAQASATGVVAFRAKGPSWVEVTDAKGVVALRKVLIEGEAASASGALPLQVTVGRVDFTEVQVRGKAFDLRPVTRDNVARFEVK